LRLSTAVIVISGMMDRSWNSRIEKARSPNGVRSRPAERSIGSTCAVEDSASGSPSAIAAVGSNPASVSTPARASPQATTCTSPSPRISCFIRHSLDGFSSSPTMNSRKVMPSSAMPILPWASPTSRSACGPTTIPASR